MQIIGSSFATFLESPASSAVSTTAVTSLYAPDGCHVDRWRGVGRGPWLWTACTLLSMALMSHAVFELY